MRRSSLLLLMALLYAENIYALSVDTDKRPLGDSAVVEQQEIQKSQAVKNSGKKAAPPVSTFTPTERISADSAVSFPVDI